MLDCDEVATRTISTSMGSPGAGMVLENLPALKQGVWTFISLTYQSQDMGCLGEEDGSRQGSSLLLRADEERDSV